MTDTLRPALSWGDALLRINELEAELKKKEAEVARLAEKAAEQGRNAVELFDALKAHREREKAMITAANRVLQAARETGLDHGSMTFELVDLEKAAEAY